MITEWNKRKSVPILLFSRCFPIFPHILEGVKGQVGGRKNSRDDRNCLRLVTSVQFSCSVACDSLWPHVLQQAMPPCPSPTLGVYSNLCPLSWWCHPTISSSVVPFSSCLQTITLCMRQQKRHWCIEQSFGLCGRGRGWEDLGEWHWNT